MKVSRAFVAMLAASLTIGLALAPSAVAAPAGESSATAQSAQKRVTTRALNTRLNSTRRQVATARRNITRLTNDLGALGRRLTTAEGGVNTILAAAPQLISGLTQLGDVVRTQIGPGLTTLANTVRDQIGPGLTRLGDAFSAVEYGVAGLTVTGAGVSAVGGNVVSSDIPDDGNPAVVQGRTIIQTTGAGAVEFNLRAIIRSNEGDNSAQQTTGQAGGFATVREVTPTSSTGGLQDCVDDDLATGGQQNAFILGTPTGATIATPTGNKTDLNLVNIPGGVGRTETKVPDLGSPNLFPAALPRCRINAAGAGELYEVNYTVNFTDIPTTTTPGPKD